MSRYDDPKAWAELAAKLYDERAEDLTQRRARADLLLQGRPVDSEQHEEASKEPEAAPEDADDAYLEWEEDDPTDVRIPGLERPRGTREESIEPAPGETFAHLVDEDAGDEAPAWNIPPQCTEFLIGRAGGCDLQVRVDGEVSSRHARILRRRDRFVIEDLDSSNGTLVNGDLVESRRLFGGELIQVGLSRYRFLLVDG